MKTLGYGKSGAFAGLTFGGVVAYAAGLSQHF
jgi:hypothetical protein